MKNIIIGTAGHIDHGKTSLIKALTGRDTDRLKEEKERGITIDLGFTWFDLPNKTRVGIIDVPGHEKFINNMVSGVVGMDMVLMIVAADEGMMPQTKEHLNILELLGIKNIVLVITKADLVDEEWLMLVVDDLKNELKDTIMKDSRVHIVSSHTGEGLLELKNTIMEMIDDTLLEKDINTIARLPIDRVFSINGFGTVVTGTLISGSIKKEEILELFPKSLECKVRNIQVHGNNSDIALAGQRVAINLANIKKEEIKRGDVLASLNSIKVTKCIDAKISILKDSNRTLKNRDRVHLYTGTSEVLARVVILDKNEVPKNEEAFCQILLEEELALKRGDRFIIRFYSPLETIGGGVVLEPNPRKKKRFKLEDIEEIKKKSEGSLEDVVEINIKNSSNTMISKVELAKNMSLSIEDIEDCLSKLKENKLIVEFTTKKDVFFIHRDFDFKLKNEIDLYLKAYHEKYPYRVGVKKALVQQNIFKEFKLNLFELYLEYLKLNNIINIREDFIFLYNFELLKDSKYLEIEKFILNKLESAKYELLKLAEIDFKAYKEEEVFDILRCLEIENKIVGISDEIFIPKHLIDKVENFILDFFKQNKILTIALLRDELVTSRKSAKAIIEYFDTKKITKKVGAETERISYR